MTALLTEGHEVIFTEPQRDFVTVYEDVQDQSTEDYFRGNQFAIDAFNKKYTATDNETYVQSIWRVCKYVARAEATPELQEYWARRWFDEIYNDWWHPAGSIMQGADSGRSISLGNCTTVNLGTNHPEQEWDNLESIVRNAAYNVSKMAAFRQGLGMDFSRLRPTNTSVYNSSNKSQGAIHWMKFIDSIGYYVGQCLHGDTLIPTETGYRTISDICNNEQSVNIVSSEGMTRAALFHKNGPKQMFLVRSQYGDEIIASADHKFVVPNEQGTGTSKKALSELQEGDLVVSVLHEETTQPPEPPIAPFLYPTSDYNGSNRLAVPPRTPSSITSSFAYIAGLVYGDGCNTDGHIEIALSNDWPEIKEKLDRCLYECFGVHIGDYGISCKPGDGECEQVILGRWFTQFLSHAGFVKAKAGNMVFPAILSHAPRHVVISFFDGLFDADGHNAQSRRNIELTLKDHIFLKGLKHSLARFGIVSSIRLHGQKEGVVRMSIVGHDSLSRLCSWSSSAKLADGCPLGKYDRLKTPYTGKGLSLPYNDVTDINGEDYLSFSKYTKYVGVQCPLYVQRICSITPHGVSESYDLTVLSDSHTYSANGFLVSNCGRIPAMLFSLRGDHPDIEAFVTCKSDYTKIQNANISVQFTDDFYHAVEADGNWELKFDIPEVRVGQKIYIDADSADKDSKVEEETGRWYKISRKNRPAESVRRTIKARALLELVSKNMYNNAEPGIQNIDIARRQSNSDYIYDPDAAYDSRISSTNACSEQYLSPDSLCILASINAGKFSVNPHKYELQFAKIGPSINRFLDNVNQCELMDGTYATPNQRLAIESLRRTGAGLTNIGAWLFNRNEEYGSPEGNDCVAKFMERYNYHLYKSSIDLGREKGSFGLFNREKFEQSPFVQRMMGLGLQFDAMRNVTCSSIAPTGCGLKSTKINTDQGVMAVEDIFKANGLDCDVIEKGEGGKWFALNHPISVYNVDGKKNDITKLYYNGYQPVKTIKCDDLTSYTGTFDHKILVADKDNIGFGKWKTLNDIEPDDEIIILEQ